MNSVASTGGHDGEPMLNAQLMVRDRLQVMLTVSRSDSGQQVADGTGIGPATFVGNGGEERLDVVPGGLGLESATVASSGRGSPAPWCRIGQSTQLRPARSGGVPSAADGAGQGAMPSASAGSAYAFIVTTWPSRTVKTSATVTSRALPSVIRPET